MKKLFLVVLAAVGLASCVQNEELAVAGGNVAIAFGDSYVHNATKADPTTTTETIEGFDVWAFMDEVGGTVLADEDVTKSGGKWGYANIQYWAPNHTYYFAALSPMNSANITSKTLAAGEEAKLGLGEIAFTNVAGTEDLLYAKEKVSTPATLNELTAQGMDAVEMEFQHLLSKVKFTFQNGFGTSNMTVQVSDVAMKVANNAKIDLAVADYSKGWTGHAGETVLAFGDTEKLASAATGAAADERLTIPADATANYEVTFNVKVWSGSILALETAKTATISGYALEMGKAYNFTAVINNETLALPAIEFTATVNGWDNVGDVAAYEWENDGFGLDSLTGIYHVTNPAGFDYFAAQVNGGRDFAGKTVVLDSDLDLSATRALAEWTPIGTVEHAFKGTFDGAGHKVSNFKVTAVEGFAGLFGNVHVGSVKNVSVENVEIVANHYAGAVVGKGYVRIDNCHAKNVEITLSVKNGDWGDKAGAILGQNGEGKSCYVKNCSAENVNIKGYRDLGGIVGMAHNNNTVSGCSVKDITIVQDLSVDYETPAKRNTLGGVAGRLGANVTLENNTEENVAITTEVEAPEALASTLTLNSKNIAVTLVNDLDVAITSLGEQTGGSGEYKLGGEDTENITINLNGKRLNITTTYWSAIGAKNNDATITIKNGSMTSTGSSAGTWNAWDLRFSNCNYVFEDVNFEKAVALDNVGKSTLMNNVTITDNHDTDTYGLWITAEGQTVTLNNCTIDMLPATDGRGIKIDNQYVAAADEKKVTLNATNVTFKTEEKAAILVKSTAGAEINLSNVNIEAVVADTEFAVWVDEDAKAHAGKVVVNGGNVKVEGEIVDMVSVDSVPALKDALVAAGSAGAGHTIISLAAGEYTMPADWAPINVDGYHGADIVTVNGNGAVLKGMTSSLFDGGFAGGSGIVIKDLTIEDAAIVANDTQGYGAFVNCADSMNEITLINCHLINSTIITPNDGADESRLGGLVGWTSGYSNVNDGPVKTYVNIKDCSVVGCTLKGGNSTGGICGHAGASDWTYTTIENCTVKNNTIISTNSSSWRVGVAVGTANIGQVVVNNLTESGNTLTQGSLVAPTGVRSYVGRLSLGTTGSFVVDGVAITE